MKHIKNTNYERTTLTLEKHGFMIQQHFLQNSDDDHDTIYLTRSEAKALCDFILEGLENNGGK